MCATCHVYVDAPWLALLTAMQAPEDGMLESATSERRTESRLSCQIVMSPALDGIVVRTPPTQV
jgi:2Fe-2S ferredoxin